MFSLFCKNLQASVCCIQIKHHSDSSNTQIITKELCNHYTSSIDAQTHAQDIQANLANLHIATWKGTFQAFLSDWESQRLLIDKSTPISDQESQGTKVCCVMLFILILASSR